MQLKSVLAERVDLDGVQALAALVWTSCIWGCQSRVERVLWLVLTWFTHPVGVVILESALGACLAERSAVSAEALARFDLSVLARTSYLLSFTIGGRDIALKATD